MYLELTDHFSVKTDLDRAWAFFGQAENLPRITPPWLGFTMKPPMPETMSEGTVLDYTIRWMGLPIHWRTRIIDWTPPRQFIDLQIRGPYALWHHQHTFRETTDGVECTDRVIYKLPVPIISRLVHPLLVRGQLMEIFRYRRTAIGRELGVLTPIQPDVAITAL